MYYFQRARNKIFSCVFNNQTNRHGRVCHSTQEVSSVTSFAHVKRTFRNLQVDFTDSYTCIKLKECNWCNVQKKKSSSEILVNKTTGYFLCGECKHSGTWNILERLILEHKRNSNLTSKDVLSLKDGSFIYDKTYTKWKIITEQNQSLNELTDEEIVDIFTSFNLTVVSKNIYEKLNIYIDSNRKTLYFPLCLPNGRVVGYKTYSAESKKSVCLPRSECSGVILISCRKKDTVILVPTVQDLFALASQNLPFNIICLPYGISNLPQNLLFFLESFTKLVLWFGTEVGASDAARLFAKKLDERRCHLVRQNSVVNCMLHGENIKKIITAAQPTWHQAITTFHSLRDDVYSELQNYEKVQGVKWKRYPVLNKILKGHRRGELTVLTGPTGSGKTTFMSEYSLDLALEGVNTLWGSFEIRNVRLARTMLQQYAETPLDEDLELFNKWADLFEQLPIYFMMFHGQQSVTDVMNAVEHAFYVHDIAHVIIDNVQFMMGVSEDSKFTDRFWKQDHIIQSFRTFATKNNCHVTLVIHPRKEKESEDLTTNSIFGGAKAAQESDNILIIQDKRLTSIKGKKYLQVAKNRYTGDLGIMPLEFHKPSLSYAFRKKKAVTSSDEKDTEEIVK